MLALSEALAQAPSLSWSGNLYKKSYEYKRLHKKFSKEVCSGGADQKYYKFLRKLLTLASHPSALQYVYIRYLPEIVVKTYW